MGYVYFFLNLIISSMLVVNVAFLFPEVSEAIFVVTSAIKDVCGKPPTERLFLDKYGRICLCLDEIVWKVSSSPPSVYILQLKVHGHCTRP